MRIKTLEELKNLFDTYDEVVSRASDIAELPYDCDVDCIEYDKPAGMIDVYGKHFYRGKWCHEQDRFPIEWMIMPDEQIKEAKAERKHAELLAAQEQERKRAEIAARAQEAKDRAEYELLKRKFESPDMKKDRAEYERLRLKFENPDVKENLANGQS